MPYPQHLLNRVSITLAGGATGTVPHGIILPGQGDVAPDLTVPLTANSLVQVNGPVGTTDLSCTNLGAAQETAEFLCIRFHTAAGRLDTLTPGGVVLGNGLGGGAPLDAPYLTNGSVGGLINEVNIQTLAANLAFTSTALGAMLSFYPGAGGGSVFNESGADQDFRVEGDTADQLFGCDAGLDAVRIGTTVAGEIADFRASGIVFNETGAARDFRVEALGEPDALSLDGATGAIGIGSAPSPTQSSVILGGYNTLPPANTSTGYVWIEPGNVTTNAVGVNPIISSLFVRPTAVFIGGAVNAVGATVYVEDPTAGTLSYALFVDLGTSRFDGDIVGFDGTNPVNTITAVATSSTVFNETGANIDFRIEGDTSEQLFVCDAGLDAVQIGAAVAGNIADFRAGIVVLNEDGSDQDFRVEATGNPSMLAVDGLLATMGLGAAVQADTRLYVGFPTLQVSAGNASGEFVDINPKLTTSAAGSVHPYLAGLNLQALDVTAATGTVTAAATLRIVNQPNSGGLNYALWVDDGLSRFDGNVDAQLGLDVTGGSFTVYQQDSTWTLGAADNLYIDATTTPHTGTAGVIDVDTTTATASVVGISSSLTLSADLDGCAAYVATVAASVAQDTGSRVTSAYLASVTGNAGDDPFQHVYTAFNAGNFAGGGSAAKNAVLVGTGWGNALRALSGSIMFVDYAATIQGMRDTAGAGDDLTIAGAGGLTTNPCNGGRVVLYGGAQVGAGTQGYVKIGISAGAPGTITVTQDDLYVKGQMEVDGLAAFDGGVRFGLTAALGGGAAATLNGAIWAGAGGPQTAAQNEWITVQNAAGQTRWIPAWA